MSLVMKIRSSLSWPSRMPLKIGLFFLAAIAMAVLVAERRNKDRDVWRAVVLALPARISPSEMSITGYYIIKQTHEPIFRKDDGYTYSSKILRKWTRSIDYKSYTLCPDTSLKFTSDKPFSLKFFKEHLGKITARFNKNVRILPNGECLNVEFDRPARRYLDFLSSYSVAPSVSISSRVETGLGAYAVMTIDDNEVVMRRKKKVKNGFNEIRIIDYKWKQKREDGAANISDYNFAVVPKDLGGEGYGYRSFDNMSLKSYVLLINLPDPDLRRAVYNCIDIDALRNAFVPDAVDFNYTETILPVGVPGGHPGRPPQECRINRAAIKRYGPIIFANWRKDNVSRMEAFAAEFLKKTGLRIKIVNYPAAELGRRFHDKPKPYGLVIIATAPDSDENYRMLASYFGKNNLLDFDVPRIGKMYEDLKEADAPEQQKSIAETIAGKIETEHVLLPLYQTGRRIYYPKAIKNMMVGREVFEYPEIAEFRW